MFLAFWLKLGIKKQWSFRYRRISTTLHQCKKCKVDKPVLEFNKSSGHKFGINTTHCKLCKRIEDFEWRCTPLGYLNKLRYDAKWNQIRRYTKRGLQPPVFPLTMEYLQELHNRQNGKGSYSRIPLHLRPLCDWQASLERLDPDGDYVRENVVLEALEFNVPKQWSADKISTIPSLMHASTNITLDDLHNARCISNPKRRSEGLHCKMSCIFVMNAKVGWRRSITIRKFSLYVNHAIGDICQSIVTLWVDSSKLWWQVHWEAVNR
eukprot:638393_1